jgi:hypothetical protein
MESGEPKSGGIRGEVAISPEHKKRFYINDLVWLCWQSEANPSLPQIGELQGDLAKLQGQCLHIPAEDPLHLSGLDRFLPNSSSRENHNS